ncbi:LysR family transcriptional regulator [Janibacter anophelis]|uniref:LysR family transcriptional regulator n=1 Tax=Janibacter anophelis TaxID=319054 RepID=UPI000831B2BB|nr:LysR family transcriptional regulator [Janibacter anophelis]
MADLPDIDIETLRLIVAVDEAGSLSAAARDRGLSQPSASARVRAFEARWQLALLDRSPRGSTLTTDGQAVIAWARRVLTEADTMRAGLASLTGGRKGEVRVAASLTIAEFILPRWLGRLRDSMEVHPQLHVVNSDRVADMVRSRLADIGFIETAARPAGLEHRVVGADRLVVVVHPDHPWASRRTPLRPETMARAEWVLREEGSGTRSTFEAALGARPTTALQAGSTAALIGAVRAGLGPGVVSERAVAAEIAARHLVAVPTALDLERPLTAVWRKGSRMAAATSELLRVASGG